MASAYTKALQALQNTAGLPLEAPSGKMQCSIGVVRMGVFFDGTGNNMFRDESNEKKAPLKFGNLDDNGPTSVVKLYRQYKQQGTILDKAYHHGPGTDLDANDKPIPVAKGEKPASDVKHGNTLGLATGAGGKPRIDWALKVLSEFYSHNGNILAKHKLFDVFGFSRGAALARDLVNQVKTRGVDDLNTEAKHEYIMPATEMGMSQVIRYTTYTRIDDTTITPKFMGIFDTVAQFFTGDSFKLDVDHQYVEFCIHMIAEDEFRGTFPVTSVFMDPNESDSSEYQNPRTYKKWMMEFWYPGAHSDIGGSYLDREGEPGEPEKHETKYDWLGRPYDKVTPAVPAGKPLLGDLQKIPLRDMYRACEKAKVPMTIPTVTVPDVLEKAYAAYCAFRAGTDYCEHIESGTSRYIHSYPDSEFRKRFYKNTMYKDFLQPTNWRAWDGLSAWWNDEERKAPREANPAFEFIRANYIHDSAAEMTGFKYVYRPGGVRISLQRTVIYAGAQPTKEARTHELPKK